MFERETRQKLKCIRSDNGGESIGPFDEYCRIQGIRHQKTVKKTPQQNGVAERMNRAIVERTRCLLSQAKLPRSFWGEAMKTTVDVINLSPSYPLNGDVPERLWTGKDVSYEHLRVFGCRAFVHIPKDERSKLDSKSRLCIFLRYGRDEFGYRRWDPVDKKIIRSRDVVFLEDQTIEDFGKGDQPKPKISDLIDMDPFPLSSVDDKNGGDVQPPLEDVDDDVTPNEVDPEIEEEHPTQELPPGFSLIRGKNIGQRDIRF